MSAEDYGVTDVPGANRVVPPMPLLANGKVMEQPVDWNALPSVLTASATDFIANKAASGENFFLMVSFYQPHYPHRPSPTYTNISRRGAFGDVVTELDAMVGDVMQSLRQHNLVQDTLVHFTSGASALSVPLHPNPCFHSTTPTVQAIYFSLGKPLLLHLYPTPPTPPPTPSHV